MPNVSFIDGIVMQAMRFTNTKDLDSCLTELKKIGENIERYRNTKKIHKPSC